MSTDLTPYLHDINFFQPGHGGFIINVMLAGNSQISYDRVIGLA